MQEINIFEIIFNIFKERNLDTINLSNIPQPETLFGLKEASKIIKDGIVDNKKIAVVGDYDVDGISASCIMEYFFKEIGFDNFTIKIPNRFNDGYGINTNIIKEIDADIFITVDNGISAFEVANLCKEMDKILIITDHHKPLIVDNDEVLPNALIINPNQKACNFLQKEICGALIAWYLCAGIKKELNANVNLSKLSCFLALAIIADMMPLVSINRAIFKLGLKEIKHSNIAAFKVIRNRYNINSQNIGFVIAPILNSVGRLRDANLALDFFRQKDENKANEIFENLININNERKNIQNDIFLKAKNNIKKGENILIAFGKDWHEGVLGIVASRLADEFNISSFCLSLQNGILKGSGRSRNGVNLIASVQFCKDYLLCFGGHSGAVGLSLESKNLELFMQKLDKNCIIDSTIEDNTSIEIDLGSIDLDLLQLLESYEPYGMANEQIEFCSSNLKVESVQKIGKNKEHQILRFSQNGDSISGILFNNTNDFLDKLVDITFFIQRDRMTSNAQLLINNLNIVNN
ncbi:single-stranded-DNA-specific exonuclease RecJ [Helicobacter sp. 16-1353]|uniref:single-stranded-DNA-specific exonuclease RecJ n=1 Tax=Helicobacter sp. 16-1353 TaxID=2004996 RepID=UPI000DCD11C3|nr:single-stranded-DNA-specific exonuclease RecJ [Helicobacter sp. 16-1353]RAX55333.1 single-stranded-DNA-specific exonuclease RecJ [Helicobacter sp. 16-1353]